MGRRPEAQHDARTIGRDRALHAACQLMGLFFSVLLAEAMGDSAGSLEDARRAMDLAKSMGFGEGYARVTLGRALLLDGSWKQAAYVFRSGVEEVRARRTYLHLVPGFLVGLSCAHLTGGDAKAAEAAASEALAWTGGRGVYGADAQLALARAGASCAEPVAAAVKRAQAFVDETGALCR